MELRKFEPYDHALSDWLENLAKRDERDWPDPGVEPEASEPDDPEYLVLSTSGLTG